MELKDEFLQLLERDREFRYAVMGLLGITDVQSSLKQLIDALGKVLNVVEGLARNQAVMMDALNKVLEIIRQLVKTEESHLGMTRSILEINQRHLEISQKILESQERLWQEVGKIDENIERMWKEVNDIERRLNDLSRNYGGLSRSIGLLIERDARHYLPTWIRRRLNLSIERLERRVIENIGEFDGYAETDNKVVVAEVKTTLRLRDVKNFTEKVNKLRQTVAGREVIAIIAYVFKTKDFSKAMELARANGIKIIRHIHEEDFEEIT